MAVQAKRIKDIPEVVASRAEKVAKKASKAARLSPLGGRSFSSLTRAEKDDLLIEVLERLRMLDDKQKVVLD